jgi:hypothetical protein
MMSDIDCIYDMKGHRVQNGDYISYTDDNRRSIFKVSKISGCDSAWARRIPTVGDHWISEISFTTGDDIEWISEQDVFHIILSGDTNG